MSAILVINPGSTSTKLAIFSEGTLLAEETLRHSVSEISSFHRVVDQTEFRFNLVEEFVNQHNMMTQLIAVVGRGGLLKPIPGGTYMVNQEMLDDLTSEKYNTHASNLGAILADRFAKKLDIPAFIVDPVVVDEMQDLARISGLEGIERRSVSHVLNQRAVARHASNDLGLDYHDSAIIVAHLGGGISIGAHKDGRIIDVINGIDGEGPYSPERSGTLPLLEFSHYILERQLDVSAVKKLIAGNSGLKSYLGETDLREVQKRIDAGDKQAKFYLDGMCYQIAKGIGEMAVVLHGNVDCIVLTGGAVYSDYISEKISDYVHWISKIIRHPGEMEMEALYEGAIRVLNGEEQALDYRLV